MQQGHFRAALTKAKLLAARYAPYSLTDTFASYLLSLGATIVHVSSQPGHSGNAVTLAHYATVIEAIDEFQTPPQLSDGEVSADLLSQPSGHRVVTDSKKRPING
jgi:hypothetical protein